jgi:hypothetical protein
MVNKLNITVKVEKRPNEYGAWQVVSVELGEHRPFFLTIFHGAHAEDLATEYATSKFARVILPMRLSKTG